MSEPAYLALIHAEIDDELDEHQRAELSRHLLADPESRAAREGLRRVCAALDELGAVEPPAQLRASILERLPPRIAPQARARRSAYGFSSQPAWRYAALFAGVFMAGVVIYYTGLGHSPDSRETAGTMAGSATPARVRLDGSRVDFGSVTGEVGLYRGAAGVDLELQLLAATPVDVVVRYGDQSVRINGLGRAESPDGPRPTVALPGFGAGAQTVKLTFLAADHEIGSASLQSPAGQ